jgi:predicted transcriptional regulator of viral defense system
MSTATPRGLSLGPVEYQILARLADERKTDLVVRRDDEWLRKVSRRPDHALAGLAAKGQLIPVGVGRYVARPLGSDPEASTVTIQDAIHAWLSGFEYYVGFHSALSEHGLTDLDDPTTYLAVRGDRQLPKRAGKFADASLHVARVTSRTSWFGKEHVRLDGAGSYWRSDLERTLLDCLERPDLSGSTQVVVRSWARAVKRRLANLSRLSRYAEQLGPAAIRRTGFWLETIGADERYIERLFNLRTSTGLVILSPRGGDTRGHINRRWRVVVNIPETTYRGWIEYGK